MALGFYCRTKSDFDSLFIELELLSRKAGSTPLLTVAQGPPPPSPVKKQKYAAARNQKASHGGGSGVRSPRMSDLSARTVSDADPSEADSEEDSEDWEML
jgi:hypothetical protein